MRLHSLFFSEWKETPNSDVIFTDSPTSAIRCVPYAPWIATWSDTVCRIRSHSQPHDKSHAVSTLSGHMESPWASSVYMLFHFCRITHNACRLSPAYILTISPRFTVAPCVFTQRLRKTIRRINSRLRRRCVNTDGATVNRDEIVSMYAGLNAYRAYGILALQIAREQHKNPTSYKKRDISMI